MNQEKQSTQLLKPFIVLIVLACCHVSKAQDTSIANNMLNRQLKPLVIDGKEDDWTSTLPYNDEQAGISYLITHDDSFVYLSLQPKNEFTQAKILRGGLSVFVNSNERKKQTTALMFPLTVPDDVFPAGQFVDLKTMEALAFVNARQYRLKGFQKGNETYTTGQKNDAGVEVAIGSNKKGELIYEAAIPFSAFYGKEKISAGDSGKSIAIGFLIAGISKPASSNAGAVPPGPRGGGQRGRGRDAEFSSANNNNPNRPPDVTGMQQLSMDSKTWKVITLSVFGQ